MESFNNTTTVQYSGGNIEVPLFVSYLKMIMLLLGPLAVGIPSVLVIRVIVVVKKLHTKYFFFLVNLLITDFLGLLAVNLLQLVAIIMYIGHVNFKLSCLFFRVFEIPPLASQLLFATLGIDRLMAIACPFRYRKVMTNKFAISIVAVMWGLTCAVGLLLLFQAHYAHVYPFGRCHTLKGFPLLSLFKGFIMFSSTVLIIAINVKLYYKIMQSKKRFKENSRLAGESSTTTRKRATFRENLRSHIKPTISVLLLGSIDGLINILVPMSHILLRLTLGNDSMARVYIVEFVIYPLQWVQLMCHPLVYGLYMTKIRRRIFDFELYHRIFSRRSKVVVLNKNWRQHLKI